MRFSHVVATLTTNNIHIVVYVKLNRYVNDRKKRVLHIDVMVQDNRVDTALINEIENSNEEKCMHLHKYCTALAHAQR